MKILWFEQANEKIKEAKTAEEADRLIDEYFKILTTQPSICSICKYYSECVVATRFHERIKACHYYRRRKEII